MITFALLVAFYVLLITQISKPETYANKLWRRVNSDEGYEYLHSGILSSICWCVIIFVGFVAMGVMWIR